MSKANLIKTKRRQPVTRRTEAKMMEPRMAMPRTTS